MSTEVENEIFVDDEDDTLSDKFMLFNIGREVYGLEIKVVKEIIEMQTLTPIPNLPKYMVGIINLRSNIIPIMDIRLRFNMEKREIDDRTCIIIVDLNGVSMGIIVDRVSEVLKIDQKMIDKQINTGSENKQEQYIKGLAKVGDEVKILLDPEKLYDFSILKKITQEE